MNIKFSSATGAYIEFGKSIEDIVRRFSGDGNAVTYFTHGEGDDLTYHVYINDSLFGWAHAA